VRLSIDDFVTVEMPEQLTSMAREGCESYQGYD